MAAICCESSIADHVDACHRSVWHTVVTDYVWTHARHRLFAGALPAKAAWGSALSREANHDMANQRAHLRFSAEINVLGCAGQVDHPKLGGTLAAVLQIIARGRDPPIIPSAIGTSCHVGINSASTRQMSILHHPAAPAFAIIQTANKNRC